MSHEHQLSFKCRYTEKIQQRFNVERGNVNLSRDLRFLLIYFTLRACTVRPRYLDILLSRHFVIPTFRYPDISLSRHLAMSAFYTDHFRFSTFLIHFYPVISRFISRHQARHKMPVPWKNLDIMKNHFLKMILKTRFNAGYSPPPPPLCATLSLCAIPHRKFIPTQKSLLLTSLAYRYLNVNIDVDCKFFFIRETIPLRWVSSDYSVPWLRCVSPRGKSLEKSCTRFHDHVIFFEFFDFLIFFDLLICFWFFVDYLIFSWFFDFFFDFSNWCMRFFRVGYPSCFPFTGPLIIDTSLSRHPAILVFFVRFVGCQGSEIAMRYIDAYNKTIISWVQMICISLYLIVYRSFVIYFHTPWIQIICTRIYVLWFNTIH